MTTTTQPVPVGQQATKQGPNKVLLVLLGVLVAVALFMFGVKPLLLDSKPAPPPQPAATTQAPAGSGSATSGAAEAPSGTGGAAGAGEGTADGTETGTVPQADALPHIPAQYAGQQARDPFVPLVKDAAATGATSN